MDGQEKYLIPRRLDDMPQLFFWDADVAVIAIAFILLGSLFAMPIPGAVLGILLARALFWSSKTGHIVKCIWPVVAPQIQSVFYRR